MGVQVLIPPGETPLAGDEAQKCREFLDAVALPDEEAALVHLDVGRSFYRQRCAPDASLESHVFASPSGTDSIVRKVSPFGLQRSSLRVVLGRRVWDPGETIGV